MSQQLTLSSLFSVLALAALCISVGFGGMPLGADNVMQAAPLSIQAELTPGLHNS